MSARESINESKMTAVVNAHRELMQQHVRTVQVGRVVAAYLLYSICLEESGSDVPKTERLLQETAKEVIKAARKRAVSIVKRQ